MKAAFAWLKAAAKSLTPSKESQGLYLVLSVGAVLAWLYGDTGLTVGAGAFLGWLGCLFYTMARVTLLQDLAMGWAHHHHRDLQKLMPWELMDLQTTTLNARAGCVILKVNVTLLDVAVSSEIHRRKEADVQWCTGWAEKFGIDSAISVSGSQWLTAEELRTRLAVHRTPGHVAGRKE